MEDFALNQSTLAGVLLDIPAIDAIYVSIDFQHDQKGSEMLK